MSMKSRITLFLLLLGIVGAAPIFAGSAAIGTVAGSLNATVSGQALLPNSTVFNGDQLQVKDGAAVIALTNGSRMTLGSETQAQFFKEGNGVSITLAKGNVSMFHPAKGSDLAVNVEKWAITPGKGYKSVGEVAMLNDAVVVTAKEGSLHVTRNGRTMDVAQGKTITLNTRDAAMPQTGTSQKLTSGGNTALEAGALGAAGIGAILAGVAMSRAGNARDNAAAADSQAAAATSAANAATSAANAATSAATAAGTAANDAGCALNLHANALGQPSPYTPPTGMPACTATP